jgi:hypothetical protein
MISLEAIIHDFGPRAMRLQVEESERTDNRALQAIQNRTAPDRREAIRSWLQSYQVFQGIKSQRRVSIATAVLNWADTCDPQRGVTTVDDLAIAHEEILTICERANGEKRDFTSLASKALWLCYPDAVPIFDSFTQHALWVISKLESDITTLAGNVSEYRKFIHVWKTLYDRYASAINAIELGRYPYRVRIFDKILWLIGEPLYGRRPETP